MCGHYSEEWYTHGTLLLGAAHLSLIYFYRQYINLLRILQDLYRLGFRVISQEVNMLMGADNKGFYNLLEVVFMKEQKP